MWATLGDTVFVLAPKHAQLFRIAMSFLSDLVGWEPWEEEGEFGIVVFDRLTQGQKQVVLLQVAHGLLDTKAAPPPQHAALTAAVAAVYQGLEALIVSDIESDDLDTGTRQMVLEALEEAKYWEHVNDSLSAEKKPAQPPSVDCPDLEVWRDLVDSLRTEVLEDYDFELEQLLVDRSPEESDLMKELLRISPEYFTVVVEDPSPERLASIRQELHALIR